VVRFLATDPEVQVRFSALPDFLRSSGSGTGSTQPRDTIEELLERKSIGSDLESREYGSRDPSLGPSGTLYPQKSALTSPTSGGRSVGIVRSRNQVTEFIYLFIYLFICLFNDTVSPGMKQPPEESSAVS
jgi:hypothetical protein